MMSNRLFGLLLVGALALVGCVWRAPVQQSEVGLMMADGVSISEVKPPGRYDNGNYRSRMVIIDGSAKLVSFDEPSLVTRDKQPIGLSLSVTYARDRSQAVEMWSNYTLEARDDEALQQQVLARIPRAAKEVTTRFTLDQMLGVAEGAGSGREVITRGLFEVLEAELAELHVVLLDVGINDISPSADFLALLERKANAQVAVEVAQQEKKRIDEELLQERAQTEIEIELARRERLVAEEEAQVYTNSPELLELERLKLLGEVIGGNDKIYFVPAGVDLTLFLGTGQVVPVQTRP